MKKRHRIIRQSMSLLLLAALCLSLPMGGGLAQDREQTSVRVGYFAFDGYHMADAEGMRSGYGYDLLQHLAAYTDWTYEYVGYDKSWNEMQDMLERGEIDLLTSAQKTPERMMRFDFSAEPIGTSSTILTVRAGDTRYASADYANWDGMRVGLIEGNSRNASFAAFAGEHGFSYTAVPFSDTAEMTASLKAGDGIDAVVTSNLRSIDEEWILAQFDPSPFYIMVQKGNDALLAQVDSALKQLSMNEPGLTASLMELYYTPDNGEEIAFTPEERAYLADMEGQTLTAMLNPDRAPYSYFADGKPAGVLGQIAQEILARSGLCVEFLTPGGRSDYYALAASGKADIRFDAWHDYNEAEQIGYRLTRPYLDIAVSCLYRRDGKRADAVALVRDSDLSKAYLRYFGDQQKKITYYGTIAEAVQAVLDGRQGATYLYSGCAELAVQDDVTNRLVAEGFYGFDNAFCVAVRKGQDPRLYSILYKTIASLKASDIEAIVRKNTAMPEQPFTLIGYMYDYPLHVACFALALALIAGLGMLVIYEVRTRRQAKVQLAEEQCKSDLLADALAAAENAGAAKSQFLSRVSHEMRTPLNAIIGFLSLSKGAPPQKAEAYRLNSEVAARQLLSVINDVLDMSAIESGKLKIAQAPFDFKRLVHDVTNIFVAQCNQKGIAYETRLLTPVDEWLVGDQLRVSQILINLLSNAVKFTEKGHVWLSISQLEVQDGKALLRFEVSDTGCGMSEEMRDRLFRPFEQESVETARKYGGSGLGLSIVKNLVSMMNGTIRAESEQNAGTVFTVDLLFARAEACAGSRLPDGAEELHVLAVDDERVERDYISTVLERMGVRFACVADGDEALSELSRAEDAHDGYNICLIDWKMPNMNGIEITKRIRECYGRDVVVIVVSSYEHYQVDESAKEAGANLFVSKPLFQSSLFDLFMTLTGGRMAKRPEVAPAYDFSGRRLLLAEDNAMNRMVAIGLIERLGIACDVAEDGQIAVDRFLASAPGAYDAILMDIQMPHLDGLEATRRIRESAHPDAKRIEIIALSADAFNEDITKALSSGMNAHVAKPIEPAILMRVLDKAFRKRRDG